MNFRILMVSRSILRDMFAKNCALFGSRFVRSTETGKRHMRSVAQALRYFTLRYRVMKDDVLLFRIKFSLSTMAAIKEDVPSTSPSEEPVEKIAKKEVSKTSLEKHIRSLPGTDSSRTVNVAVSSRALFDLEEENEIFEKKGLEEYIQLQVSREDKFLKPGSAFPFIKALENVNAKLREIDPNEREIFSIALMSHNNANVGIRLQKSIDHYGLIVTRMALTGGTSPVEYLKAFNITLFLTSYEDQVTEAIHRGFPAAVMSLQPMNNPSETQLRIAFDLDAVLFSDESEKVFKAKGLDAYIEYELQNREIPLTEGPLKPFAEKIGRMQKKFDRSKKESCPIRTYIVTSRDAVLGQRALKTLREWGLEIDECFFMAGAAKDEVLKAINPHIFFDDQITHVARAREKGTPSGYVTHGISREYDAKKREQAKKDLTNAK
ncbi:cytosolic 5'-nucleotidase 1A-like isoform X2 [Actinia tenebrosa]|uniref:Cytosolic 5'-nucleotidase 1A-like isoform X2 n=1 Tax=Actinia tenebrosa TaxID=6105 RepID=A0A6P8IU13_ACTTE|nr:cytosolic 5'-nucleotidase 1A-like isoform X2 [Actinia tenebrosa]